MKETRESGKVFMMNSSEKSRMINEMREEGGRKCPQVAEN